MEKYRVAMNKPHTVCRKLLAALVVTALPACADLGSDANSRSEADLATMSFQDGVLPTKDYLGTRDTYLSENKPDTAFGAASELAVDGSDPSGSNQDLMVLMFWDLSDLHSGIQCLMGLNKCVRK